MSKSFQVFELSLGSFVTFRIRFIKDLDSAYLASVIDIGGDIESAFEEITEVVNFSRTRGIHFEGLLFTFVWEWHLFRIQIDVFFGLKKKKILEFLTMEQKM